MRGAAANEARAARGSADALAFSKKARPVNFEPCSVGQYKRETPQVYREISG